MTAAACQHCGASLEGRRAGTRFCSATCRTRALKAERRSQGLDPYARTSTPKTTRKPARNVPKRLRRGVSLWVPDWFGPEEVWQKVEQKRRERDSLHNNRSRSSTRTREEGSPQ